MMKIIDKKQNISKTWRKVKLGEILELKYGYGLTEKNRENGNIPVFGSSGVVGEHGKAAVNSEGVIIGRKGNVGSVYYSDCPFYPIDTVYYIDSLKIPGHLKFFYYLLKRIPFKSIGSDVGVPGLNRDIAYGLDVNFPEDINEQKRIADILSAFNDKIELNNKINQNLEQTAQAIFKEWFVKFKFSGYEKVKFVDSELGKIPKGWEVSTIGKELETILGGTPTTNRREYWENGNIPWINSGALNDFPLIKSTSFITEAGLKNSAAKLMPIKTVVLPLVISIGKPANISILAIESSGNQSVVGIVGNNRISSEYIYYWVNYRKKEIYGNITGGAQQHINKNIIDTTQILVPENKILNLFNKKAKAIMDLIINNSLENQKLATLRDLLLPKLMSGETRVKV